MQSFFIGIEGVGVLHDKFLDTDQTESGTRFISELRLELVEIERHVLVGLDHRFCRIGKEFFVRRT